ncbi:DUF6314 family protein [Terrihabitans sp. B22-R8]|uniref:DUF6314 family protein n=1 Tax=Terrihabitans sp. B22-R8 TaxID=3425128 RepID=UPI00403C8027
MDDTLRSLFAGLEGSWRLDRVVAPAGTLSGTADFSLRSDGGLDYQERGDLVLPHGTFAAERRYRFDPEDDGFSVHFADAAPRLFHRVRLSRTDEGSLIGEAPHRCGRDLYVTAYRFASDGTFTIVNSVTGPNKDYTVTSAYTRIGSQRNAA